MHRTASLAALLTAVTLTGCATLRAPARPAVAEPLPLVAGVCPGPFNDYGGEGRDLLKAVRERRLFRDVVDLRAQNGRGHADLALVPHVGAPEPHMAVGIATLVPWAATATIFPWIVQASDPVRVTLLRGRDGTVDCRGHGSMPADGRVFVVEDTTRRTTSMAGWTSLLLMLHPRWESGQVYEFRPVVDELVERREELVEFARQPAGKER